MYFRSLLLRSLHQVKKLSVCLAEAAEEDPYALGAKATTICQLVNFLVYNWGLQPQHTLLIT